MSARQTFFSGARPCPTRLACGLGEQPVSARRRRARVLAGALVLLVALAAIVGLVELLTWWSVRGAL